ncbi:hypothetical protein BTJ68_01495 [Hortaea werneckii EXF-2000]|uniref:Enoyl reductase (ER) domain-containing protein n=1 Tax=Hortaea werneckii EXF-2000 TaxID=1157616 RepID=A0A1Z5TS83_HORWE|nr:hypothetical protein BTJ68_01495 [Hortaea werneckii EXF-2000]
MKSILISSYASDPSLLSPTDVPTPSPGKDEYLVRVTHCSPQHADILHAQGKHQNNNPKRGWCFPPFTLGYDFAGIIQSVPEQGGKADLRKGDRVFGQSIGAFADYAAVAHVAKVQAGETVMVSGASGGLGSVCCMVAKALGAKVIALAGDEEKARHMREDMDVDLVVVQTGAWISKVQTFTGGQGVDVMLDNTGMVNDALRCMAYFGRVVILGFAARKGIMEDVKMNKLLLKSITVTGYRFGESGRRYPEELQRIWDGYLSMMKNGQLAPLLYGKYEGLEDVGRALKDLAERKVYGKIVIKVAEDVDNSKL